MHRESLDSWKSIADYLHRSTRTVQRWYANHGLPVRHLRGPRGAAFAYIEEVDAWLSGFTEQKSDEYFNREKTVDARGKSLELTAMADELWEIRSEKNIQSISQLYREAIDEDSRNAAAYAGLADAMIFVAVHGMAEGSMAYSRAVEALQRISRIEPGSIKRKSSAAWLDLAWKRKWGRARAGFDEILREGPRTSSVLSGRALLHIAEGNLNGAWESAWEAWNLNTLVRPLSALLCWISYLAGEYEKSLQQISDVRISGGYGATHAAIEALSLIQTESILAHLERLEGLTFDYPHDRTLQGALGYFYAISNQIEKALEMLDCLGITDNWNKTNSAYAAALVLIGLERHDDAIQALEASYAAGSEWSLGFRCDPMLKPLRGDRRFRDLLRKAGPNLEKESRRRPPEDRGPAFGSPEEKVVDVQQP